MARDQKSDQRRADADAQTASQAADTAQAQTQFVTTGAIPPVETAAGPAAPSASDRAFGKTGPGVQALEALIAKGNPQARDVAGLIDAHRDEHDAMLALVETKLGKASGTLVRKELDGLRVSIANKEIVAGDPGDPNANYLDISQKENGAKWRAADGKFTGTANKDGLDTDVKVGAKDDIHAKVKPDKSGTVDWNHDGKTEAELYGNYKDSKDYAAGVKRTNGDVTEGVEHKVDKGTTSDMAYADYKKGDSTAHAEVGLKDGKAAEGISGATTIGKHDKATGSVSHDAKGTNAEIKDTHDFGGGTTGSLDASYKAGTIAETGTLKTKTDDFSETVSHDKKGTNVEVKDTHDFGHGTKASVDVKDAAGKLSETASVTHKGTHDTETATVAHDDKGTTGSLEASYQNGGTKLDGNVKRQADQWTMHAGASQQVNKELSVSGKVDETIPDKGKPETVVGVSEQYKSGKVIEGLDLEGGKGAHDYLKATGSVSGQLAPNLYGSGWGSYSYEAGHQNTAQLGASLTFTPQEKQALTLAGLIDEHGRVETRLQYDLFKDKINGISDLDQHKKDAMLSIFVSYSQQVGGHRALDDRFGGPDTFATPNTGSQVMAGFRIRF
jgi:hypothetical protein